MAVTFLMLPPQASRTRLDVFEQELLPADHPLRNVVDKSSWF